MTRHLVLLAAVLAAAKPGFADEIRFNRDVRPILSDTCFKCHGPDNGTREAGLRLDVAEGAYAKLESGERAIVPKNVDASELVKRITSDDEFTQMPPPESGKSLTPEQIDVLERWVEQGATYEGHWSFIPPKRPELPEVKTDRGRNEIDRFVLARLEEEGLGFSPEADRRTLIRRVTFDLTGLPPTPEAVRAFVEDESPGAYEKVVDRLLGSPAYAEHMTRYWLDAARYGDTHGLHLDNYREMWPYRDWVIDAHRENMPYDRFVTEQLAGDLLPNATLEQRIASGFNRCNVTTSEGGSIAEEVYVRNVVDRVETFGTVFLGMTTGCAVCHDHKFDPLTQRDFYSLFAYFNSLDANPLDGNKKDHPPVVRVPTPQQQDELRAGTEALANLEAAMEKRRVESQDAFEAWLAEAEKNVNGTADVTEGLLLHMRLDEREGTTTKDAIDETRTGTFRGEVAWQEGHARGAVSFANGGIVDLGDAGRFERNDRFSYGAWVKTPGNVNGTPIARMEMANGFRGWDLYVAQKKVAMHLINSWTADALKVTTTEDVLKPNSWHHVFVTYDGSGKASGVTIHVDGVPRKHDVNVDTLKSTTITDVPLQLGKRNADSPFNGGSVDDVRIYGRTLSTDEVKALAGNDPIAPILAIAREERTPDQSETLQRHFLANVDEKYREMLERKSDLEKRMADVRKNFATTLVFKERAQPKPAYLLVRGEYDHKGDEVPRATPGFLPEFPGGAANDRLGLAKWLLGPEHPLFARVTVNRFWQQCFGTGIVKTSEDFGSQGEWPSHPELLDWLAVEFRENGWDVHHVLRLIVTSAAYRQDSRVTPELVKRDPENRLLARGPRHRLDAEQIRDQALFVSGMLVDEVGGPSVKPPQPDGIWKAVGYSGSNTVRFTPDKGDAARRRSVYTFWKRTAPPPQMRTLDAPSRESCRVRRERTNTPLQALLLMNEEQYVECCRKLAERSFDNEGLVEETATSMFGRVLAREPKQDELEELLSLYEDCLAEFQSDVQAADALLANGDVPTARKIPAPVLAAWTIVANTVLNLDETLNKN